MEGSTVPVTDIFADAHPLTLNIREVSRVEKAACTVRDIQFAGVQGDVDAYLVVPRGNGPFAAILWVHWLGEHNSNRTEFLQEAEELAAYGVVSLLVDTLWANPDWYNSRIPEEDVVHSVNQVKNIRRGMEVLLSQPHLDLNRVGYVGHDFGGMFGIIVGGIEQRAKTFVVIAATTKFENWYLYAAQPQNKDDYLKQIQFLDPVNYLPAFKNQSIFFQFASVDFYVSDQVTADFYLAARAPKQMATYDDTHAMSTPAVRRDRIAWLHRELNF